MYYFIKIGLRQGFIARQQVELIIKELHYNRTLEWVLLSENV